MGFNEFIVPGRGAETETQNGSVSAKKVLEKQTAKAMLQALAQLCDVRSFATEIFTNLQKEAAAASARINDVQGRIEGLQKIVPSVEDMCHKSSPLCFFESYTNQKLSRTDFAQGGFFIRTKAPESVNRRRHEATDPPDLNVLNRYEKCLDLGKRTSLNCLDLYTNPMFFFDEWRKNEMAARKERKKKRKKKKKKKKRNNEPKNIAAAEKWYTDELGNKRLRKTAGVAVAVEERTLAYRGVEVTATDVSYGNQADYSQYESKQQRSGTLFEPSPLGSMPQQTNTPTQHAPPMVSSGTHVPQAQNAGPPQHHQQPVKPVMNNAYSAPTMSTGPPPGPAPTMSSGPPQFQAPAFSAPVQPAPVQVAPAAPAKPVLPDYLKKYAKMVKIGLPPSSVKHKMAAEHIDESLYDLWLDPNGPQGATAGASGTSAGPPPGPGSGPPAGPPSGPPSGPPAGPGRGGLMASITAGKALKKAAPVQARPVRGGGILDAIRSGKKLQSAKSRKLNEIDTTKVVVNKRDNMMAALRGGIKLKKTAPPVKKKKPEEDGNIFALMKMRDLIEDSDDESDDDESWSS